MIEILIKKHLESRLNVKVALEYSNDEEFVLVQKLGSKKKNHLNSANFAFQAYSKTMYDTALLNEKVKEAVESMIELDDVFGVNLNSDYIFTDTQHKRYRYQAVFEIKFY